VITGTGVADYLQVDRALPRGAIAWREPCQTLKVFAPDDACSTLALSDVTVPSA
jgi:hypothetical protein